MARERSEQPRPLGAAIVPVQRALLARAKALEDRVAQGESPVIRINPVEAAVLTSIANEFRALADELSHW